MKIKFLNKTYCLPIILYKMLFQSFAYWYLIAQGLFVVLFLIADLFMRIEYYISAKTSILNILFITLLSIPKGMWLTMPVAIMFGVIMALGSFYQNNELIAIFTCAISLTQFTLPIIVFNIFLSFFMIFGDSSLVIPVNRFRDRFYDRAIKKNKNTESQEVTIRGSTGDYFWNADHFDHKKRKLTNVIIFEIDKKYRPIFRLDAESAVYTKSGWLFKAVKIRKWDEKKMLISEEEFNKKIIQYPETPDIFEISGYDIENMTIREARKSIERLKEINVDHSKEKTNYYKKFSFPFTLLIVALFAIGVSTLSKVNVLIIAMSFSIGLAVLYYIMQLILDVLAYDGQIPAIVGAWLAFVFFLPVALFVISKAKT